MGPFAWGLVVGWFSAVALAAVAAVLAYQRMVRLQDRARQAERLAELGTLTGGLAHEIKNPLSTIHLNLQLLLEDVGPVNPAYSRLAHRLRICESEAGRLRETLDDFLRYAGKIELERKSVELNNLCENMVDFFLSQAQSQRVQLRLKRFDGEVRANADERLLKQAVLNLMLNGMQAMPQGGELIISVSQTAREAVVDVMDTGTGIAPDVIQRIFDAYYSTKKSGTGLGLPMTRRIAREHGGEVVVTSEQGKGSNFSLRIPLAGFEPSKTKL